MGLLNKGGYMLGLALLVPSAALMVACWMCPCMWLWRRWRREAVTCEGVKRVRQNVSVEFVIPESVVGFVIGRRGASVRQVEEESGARVQFKDQQGTKDKVVVISGRPSCVKNAQELIQSAVDERLSCDKGHQTVTLTLSQKAVGRVIGRQGANIRSIQKESGAKVTLMNGGRSDAVRVCEVVGSPEQLSRAVALIQEQVARSNKPRPPTNHQQGPVSETTELRPLNLPQSDDYIPVFVSSVDGHGGVWLQPIAQEDPGQLEDLVEKMTQYYRDSTDVPPDSVHIGAVYAAPFDQDGSWYRVRVSALSCDGVEVVYLDYGDYAPVNTSVLRQLQPQFMSLKVQAVRCLLDGVIPTAGVWSEAGLEALEQLTYSSHWKVVMARVVNTQVTPRVQLVDTSTDKDVDIAKSLVISGHAQWIKPHPPYPRSLRYHRDGHHPLLPLPNHVTLFDQSDCCAYVSYVQSPDLVFLIPVGYDIMLTQLSERLNITYDQSDESIATLQQGDLVAARFPLDKQWYRGHVISYNQSDCSALLRLVDYGVVVCLPITELKMLREEFCEEKVYCVPCALASVKPRDRGWSDEATQFLREVTNQGDWISFPVKLTGCHSNVDDVSIPDIIIESLNTDTSVNAQLVSNGLASEVKGREAPEGGEECDGVSQNVRFRWNGASEVSVAGSFSEWREVKLKRGVSGEFETDLDVSQGTHEYKYLVDGTWQHDHSQPTTFNSYGTLNNVLSTTT